MMEERKNNIEHMLDGQQTCLHSEWASDFYISWCQNETIEFILHVHVQTILNPTADEDLPNLCMVYVLLLSTAWQIWDRTLANLPNIIKFACW